MPLPAITLSSQSLTIALAAIATIIIVEFAWIIILETRLRRFMRGENGASLERTVRTILDRHDSFESFRKEMSRALSLIDTRIRTAPRGVGTVRFDAFSGDGSGGRQSFATALVSEDGDGVVISSLHARAVTRIFAKPVHAFTSEHELTEEEARAIEEARAHAAIS